MSSPGSIAPLLPPATPAHRLSYRRLGRDECRRLADLDLDPIQVERFLGPIDDILHAVARGPAHSAVAIEVDGSLAGFFVVHPDLRDRSCWWLGWLALDRAQQGHGYGRAALRAVLDRLGSIPECRTIRLLVAPDNIGALALYGRAGFTEVDRWAATGELVMQLILPPPIDAGRLDDFNLVAVAARSRRVFRHRRLRQAPGPHEAWVIGVERGPPNRARLAA